MLWILGLEEEYSKECEVSSMAKLLEVKNLKVTFDTMAGVVKAVDGVSYHINEEEVVGLVGESGCGKSVSQMASVQLISTPPGQIVGGEVIFEGRDLLKYQADSNQMRSIRGGKIAMIFQEPMTSLNPVFSVGEQIMESLILHLKLNRQAARQQAIELLEQVGIPDAAIRIDDYPHEFSGGMRQRGMIAMALSCHPRLVIADEPTTALDVTTQAQVLDVMMNMVKRFRSSLVIVTHNLGVVARHAQRIYVMYAGRIVEAGTSDDVFNNPRHPYTIALLKSVPRLDEPRGRQLVPILGLPPNLINMPPMCAFKPRCSLAGKCKKEADPELRQVGDNHFVRCHIDIREESAKIFQMPEEGQVELPKANTLLEVNNLRMYFPVTQGIFRRKVGEVKAVDDVSFKIRKGEVMGIVGESGCGKTTIGRCILRIHRPTTGHIIFKDQDIADIPSDKVRDLRRQIQLIFQDPYSSLDPRQSAGSIVGEALKIHRLCRNKEELGNRVNELFAMVGLDPEMTNRYPHEFSGGQRQRIGIARALSCSPSFLVCDEPISALDVSIQAQIINLLQELKERLGLTYLLIAHDLSVIRHISDTVAVMYLGHIVEITGCEELYSNPLMPYTKALLSAVPIPDPSVEKKRERIILKGEVPSPLNPPSGCPFHPRCWMAIPDCSKEVPLLRQVSPNHMVACIRV
jgi:peptide/nickel transport system ATP-binding protein